MRGANRNGQAFVSGAWIWPIGKKALIDRVVYMGLLDDDALIHDLRIRWVGQIDGAKYFEPAASVAIRKNLSYLRE